MKLDQALETIAVPLGLNASDMIMFANEDDCGGFHIDESKRKWTVGSIWEPEGKFLYAVIRALMPSRVLELGAYHGCSTTHILSALTANGKGKLVSVDLYPYAQENVKEPLTKRWTFECTDFISYLENVPSVPKAKFDVVFEDGPHDRETTEKMIRAVYNFKAGRPKLIISHDAEHYLVGQTVREGFSAVLQPMHTVLIDDTDCGFAWWVDSEKVEA